MPMNKYIDSKIVTPQENAERCHKCFTLTPRNERPGGTGTVRDKLAVLKIMETLPVYTSKLVRQSRLHNHYRNRTSITWVYTCHFCTKTRFLDHKSYYDKWQDLHQNHLYSLHLHRTSSCSECSGHSCDT